ncbi:hypothetical protein Trisim1_001432 [Trichoderma cf. simile WF8]|uniref:Zn(2)-C6 fungal-type domain-containing protein n=1 Tax=Trichoderma guizhouense TaxID=1491466 RepID=A0A1T3CUE0_9HYPO|nr:hypothetical protein A0O28_0088380 [Trichoderma guizhouense]
MQRSSKQKSCFKCKSSKRRCDRTLPSCTRCIDHGVECAYPFSQDLSDRGSLDSRHSNSGRQKSFDAHSTPIQPRDAFGPEASSGVASSHQASGLSSSSAQAPTIVTLAKLHTLSGRELNWFTPPSTWVVVHHYHPPGPLPSPQVFTEFFRGLQRWLVRFQREGHNPFIHRQLYPPREIPDCIQDAYAAIAVSIGSSAENQNMTDSTTISYAEKLIAQQATLVSQPLNIMTAKDHLARTQALLIHLILALSSASISRQAKANGWVETLHRWKTELLASAEQESSVAQLFPCESALALDDPGSDIDPIPDLHRAFLICESIRRTWLLCSVSIGMYRSLTGDWINTCGGDICFTARASLWSAASSAAWASIARTTDPLFEYSLRGEEVAKRGIPAMEVDEFARHIFTLMWGADKVESWVFRTRQVQSAGH